MSKQTIVSEHEAAKGSVQAYVIGYGLSLICTFIAYFLTAYHLNNHHESISHQALAVSLTVLAISQLIVQLIFFLHLNKESKPRWNLTVFGFMLIVLVIVVFGSLWVMTHLDYHHDAMTPAEKDEYLLEEEGIHH